jgi:hypothetical protein
MWGKMKRFADFNVFPILCYLLSAYFFFSFCLAIGIPPSKPLDATNGTFLALSLFFFMLPEAKKLKLGQLFEYEARVKGIKEDVNQFKDETRATLAVYTGLVSAISNTVSQTINVNLPGREEASRAKEDLDTTLDGKAEPDSLEAEIENFVASGGNDLNYALAKLRMQLEKELRRILGKHTKTQFPIDENTKFMSTRSLFSQFTREFPKYQQMYSSFDFILKVCNAAIHGQSITEGYAHEALYMGLRMLDELKNIDANGV